VGPVIDAEARAQIEAHIERMQAAGQKVTRVERKDGPLRSNGSPGIVVAIREADYGFSDTEGGDNYIGRRLNVRYATFTRDKLVTFWVEHTDLVPYRHS